MSQTSVRHLDVLECRRQFPALFRKHGGLPVVYFDGAAGTQVPHRVLDAVCRYLVETNANRHGVFSTSQDTDRMIEEAQQAVADFLGTDDPQTVIFGPNMTSLTFALSRALMKTWKPGDEIVLTRLEHDANFTPWILAAREVGVVPRIVDIHPEDCSLDLEDLARQLSQKTRLVAVTCASNAVGTITPVAEIVKLAHQVGAMVFLDAVHLAPHRRIDVQAWDCDFLVCSGYKFFGPHVGVLWGKREWLVSLPAYKVRPAPDDIPDRWMTGTQNHEGIAGLYAAVEYLAEIGKSVAPEVTTRREALDACFQAIQVHEETLTRELIEGLQALSDVRIWGITQRERLHQRLPTIAITHARFSPRELAEFLATRGIFVWHGNFYALPLTERLGLEPEGLLRISMVHYNTVDEVRRVLAAMREVD
jgi:cysteine desulfurase family protein (TIGR01976 family)